MIVGGSPAYHEAVAFLQRGPQCAFEIAQHTLNRISQTVEGDQAKLNRIVALCEQGLII